MWKSVGANFKMREFPTEFGRTGNYEEVKLHIVLQFLQYNGKKSSTTKKASTRI